jgi:hypothetical protein
MNLKFLYVVLLLGSNSLVLGGLLHSKLHSNCEVPTAQEDQQIKDWIKRNNLNSFGDSQDTLYTGGTPLFNERLKERGGKPITLYQYLNCLKYRNTPKPWKQIPGPLEINSDQ